MGRQFRGVVVVLLAGVLTGVAQQQPLEKQQLSFQLDHFKNVRGVKLVAATVVPPTDAECRASAFPFPCYSPQEIREAYGLTPLLDAGYDGAGETIVIIDSFGSPTIAQDLKTFDAAYGLPDPPSFKVIAPLGTVPFDPTNNDMVGWAFETTLDVEWSHAMAPGARIVLLTSPVSETEGVQGMPEFLALENYALDHHLGKIVSQSWGATENTLFTPAGQQVFRGFERMYERGGEQGVTFLAAAGDDGTGNPDVNGNIYPFPTVGYPASSPRVTAVGGTSLYADTSGHYQSETVWNEQGGATGGGVSQEFGEPSYQSFVLPHRTQRMLKQHRGIPDVAINADPYTGILVYVNFFPSSGDDGFYQIGGTSEGSPMWAGIIADTNQLAGHPMGFLNFKLYALGGSGELYDIFHDITVGNNALNGVPGYDATKDWDLTTGWGTPKLGKLLRELAKLK
jgi:subtilase family serine protease